MNYGATAMLRAARCRALAELSRCSPTVHRDQQSSECGRSPPEGTEMLLFVSHGMLRAHGDPRRTSSRSRIYSRRRRTVLVVSALVMPVLMLPVVASAQASPFLTGATALQSNILILRCSGSEQGGTSQFASRLIGEREVIRRQTSHGRDRDGWFLARGARRSTQVSEQQIVESAVLAAELEQLPDLGGYLKTASCRSWRRVTLNRTTTR